MPKLSDLFEVRYGLNLELNALKLDPEGVNFVSRTARNNGVSARVAPVKDIEPLPAGTITVAGGGSVLESFLQPAPYYSGRDLYYLTSKSPMSDEAKLFYCACIRANRFRYSYGRQANRTLKDIALPDLESLPDWIGKSNPTEFDGMDEAAEPGDPGRLHDRQWAPIALSDLFEIKKGTRLTRQDRRPGSVAFIGATDANNGLIQRVDGTAAHPAGVLTVPYNGQGGVAKAFYQHEPFQCTDDVNVLYPKFPMSKAVALFICTSIRAERYRFSYGRKWGLDRMMRSAIGLPVAKDGKTPDWEFIERYIKSLRFSAAATA